MVKNKDTPTHTALCACYVYLCTEIYFFLRSCEHFGQNHLPFGFVVSPTQAKWNHSIGHCNAEKKKKTTCDNHLNGIMHFVNVKSYDTYFRVIASNHFAIRDLLANTIGRFIWINRHIENITWMWCCMAGYLRFWLFWLCRLLKFGYLMLSVRIENKIKQLESIKIQRVQQWNEACSCMRAW